MDGHLFIIDGDLTQLTCDAWLLPTDPSRTITSSFASAVRNEQLATLPNRFGDDQLVMALTEAPPDDGPWIWLGAVGRWWPPESSTEAKRTFIRDLVSSFADEAVPALAPWKPDGLPVRLAINVLGSGRGGLFDDKGTIHDALIDAAMEVTARGVDLVIVTRGAGPFSAAQRARRRWLETRGVQDSQHWDVDRPGLEPITPIARALAEVVRAKDLVLFLGAGASADAGLPPWQRLLDDLWAETDEDSEHAAERKGLDVRDQALLLARRMAGQKHTDTTPAQLLDLLATRLTSDRYSLVHGLLASLGARESVTTNFDCLFEAASSASRLGRPAVLPYEPVERGQPWLLKLHGSIDRDGVVLTRDDYLGVSGTRGALFGIVQAMLMTKHLLFVGYSLSDEDFHQLVYEVRAALRLGPGSERLLGTVLTLFDDPLRAELWHGEFQIVSFATTETSISIAARQQEIFLDLVAHASSDLELFLLDDTYASMLTDAERAAGDLLRPLLKNASALAATALGRDLLALIKPPELEHTQPRATRDASMPTNRDRVLAAIRREPGLTDSELVMRTGVEPHQQVNAICRDLVRMGFTHRTMGPEGFLINAPVDGVEAR